MSRIRRSDIVIPEYSGRMLLRKLLEISDEKNEYESIIITLHLFALVKRARERKESAWPEV
jgi:hypothetical protein